MHDPDRNIVSKRLIIDVYDCRHCGQLHERIEIEQTAPDAEGFNLRLTCPVTGAVERLKGTVPH